MVFDTMCACDLRAMMLVRMILRNHVQAEPWWYQPARLTYEIFLTNQSLSGLFSIAGCFKANSSNIAIATCMNTQWHFKTNPRYTSFII